MNKKRIFALAFAVLMLLALAACGTKNNDKMGDMSGNGSAMTGEPKNAEEALALHKELLEQENAILSENTELWEKVFMEADKGMAMIEDGKNYGDFLLDTVEALPRGFDTVCTPELFSQGQWQLLSIARAVATNPRILLLDEITANLDADTEQTVLSALNRAGNGRTVLSISHRLYEKNGGRQIAI